MDNLSKVKDILGRTEITAEDWKKSRNNIKKRVSDIKQKIIAHLHKIEADIHKDIDNKYKYCNDTVSRNKNSVTSSSDSLSTWKRDLKSLMQHTSEIHLFQAVKFLDAKTHQTELKIREIQAETIPILTYHPSEYESNIEKLIPDLGILTVDNVSVPMSGLDIDQQGQFSVRENRKLSLTHYFKTSELGEGVYIHRGCLIPDHRLLLVSLSDSKLYASKLDGSKPKIINLNYSPECITLYDNSHAVSSLCDDCIQIIDLATLIKPNRIVKVDGICIGITSVKDKIFVKNHSNILTIVDINGKVLNTIQTTFDPDDICANEDGDVYCTDYNSHKVFVVTSNGKEREIYSSPDLRDARGMAVDDRGDVYVAGGKSNNIHRISYDGKKHDIVLTADDGISSPTGLSYNCETRELLAINNHFRSVIIYKAQ